MFFYLYSGRDCNSFHGEWTKRCLKGCFLCGNLQNNFGPHKVPRHTSHIWITRFASRPSLNTGDNAAAWGLSGGTRLSRPSTPQLSSHPWSLLECHHVSISVSWVWGPWACPAKSSYRSGKEKTLSMYSLCLNPSTPLVRLVTVTWVAVRCCAALCLSLPR
jgi:hypothetical protein